MPTQPEVVTLDPNDAGLMGELWHAAKGTPREFTEHVRALVNPLPPEPPLWTLVRLGNGRIALREDEESGWADYWVHADVLPGSAKANSTAMTWPEVCALGTPEVLEPDSVKALRERLAITESERDGAREHRDQIRTRAERAEEVLFQAAVTDPSEGVAHAFDVIHDRTQGLRDQVEQQRKRAEKVEALVSEFVPGAFLKPATEDEPAEPAPVEVTEPPVGSKRRDMDGDIWTRIDERGWLWTHRKNGKPYKGLEAWEPDFATLEEQVGPLTLVETGGQS